MKEKDTHKQTESVFNLYIKSLKNVIDSNTDDRLASRNNHP